MNLIEERLREATPDHYNSEWPADQKLESFYRLFVDLEAKYGAKLEHIRRLELEHKAELAEVILQHLYRIYSLFHSIFKKTSHLKCLCVCFNLALNVIDRNKTVILF